MKNIFLLTAIFTLFLVSCPQPESPSKSNNNNNNDENKTTIVFNNTGGSCAVTVFDDYRREPAHKIAEVSAGTSSAEIPWQPSDSYPFYFSYSITLNGVTDFLIDFIPDIGKDQKAVRIDADITNNIVIPKLEETLSQPDALLSQKSFVAIQNVSSYSFKLQRGIGTLTPDGAASAVVNSGERALYTINPSGASQYSLLVNADYRSFTGTVEAFEAGYFYQFSFDGSSIGLFSEIPVTAANMRPPAPDDLVPAAPAAPSLTAADGSITAQWAAIHGAEGYEVYIGAGTEAPAAPVRTVLGTSAYLDGLSNKTVYSVWIKAVNSAGSSALSPPSKARPWPAAEAPETPVRPQIVEGVYQLTVSWGAAGGAASYEVYYNIAITQPAVPALSVTETRAVLTGLSNGVRYWVWVRAVNAAGQSGYSLAETGMPSTPSSAPAAPGKPVLTAGSRELVVHWQPVAMANAYEVWTSTSDNSASASQNGADISGGDTQTIITGLLNETTYYVWIKAKNTLGASGFSPAASEMPSAFAVLPLTPAAPVVTAGSKELAVSWPATEGAETYELWYSATNNQANAVPYGSALSAATLTLGNLTNGTTYYIWIKAVNSHGASGFSPAASGTPTAFAATPAAPGTPTVTAGSGQLAVNWQAVEGAQAYEVWAGTSNNSANAAKKGADIAGLSTAITGLANETTYYVWVKAKNSVGTSGFSPVANGTPTNFTAPPAVPAKPQVSIASEQLTITWTAVTGAASYEVWLGASNNSASAEKNGADISGSLSKTITGLANGTLYYVWLKAKNSLGTSGFSPVASGKPIANAAAPAVSAGNAYLTLTWTAITGADEYEVFCGTGTYPPAQAAQTVSSTSAALTGLVNGTAYRVWVRGKNSTGSGAISASASGKPIGNMGTVTLSPGNDSITASWAAVAGASQYEVYYSTGASMPATPEQTVTATQATMSGLNNGTTYYVWVKPKNANGAGAVSERVSGMPTLGELYKGAFFETAEKIGHKNLEQALSYISGNAQVGDKYYIVLGADESLTPKTLSYSNKTVGITLRTDGVERTVQLASSGNLFTVQGGITLTLEDNVTLKGRTDNTASLVMASTSGTFTMNGGTISGNTVYSSSGGVSGGGVHVSGIFTMNGGTISGNTVYSGTVSASGGGVSVGQGGIFTMNDGIISGNTVSGSTQSSGGGVSLYGSVNGYAKFTMNGGTISGNTVYSGTGGVETVGGGGVYVEGRSIFTKAGTGGVITGYGSDTVNGNKVSNSSDAAHANCGHAVYVRSYQSNPTKRLDKTVPANKALDSSVDGAPGGWAE